MRPWNEHRVTPEEGLWNRGIFLLFLLLEALCNLQVLQDSCAAPACVLILLGVTKQLYACFDFTKQR